MESRGCWRRRGCTEQALGGQNPEPHVGQGTRRDVPKLEEPPARTGEQQLGPPRAGGRPPRPCGQNPRITVQQADSPPCPQSTMPAPPAAPPEQPLKRPDGHPRASTVSHTEPRTQRRQRAPAHRAKVPAPGTQSRCIPAGHRKGTIQPTIRRKVSHSEPARI